MINFIFQPTRFARYYCFLTIFQLISINFTHAQNNDIDNFTTTKTRLIPPSPTAAALGRYGEIPISLYTGLPNIQIPINNPLANIVPVNLNYRASGIRVTEIPSWVGLGWSLDCGGVIARTVRGRPDETPSFGYRAIAPKVQAFQATPLGSSAASLWDIHYNGANGKWDLEPDTYSFNFAGHSGQFVYNTTDSINKFMVMPYQKMKIIERADTSGFTIIDENGTRYHFLDAETTQTETLGVDDGIPFYKSSWYLTRIEPIMGPSIKFTYTTTEVSYPINETQTRYVLQSTIPANNPIRSSTQRTDESLTQVTIDIKVLAAIASQGYRAFFYSTYNRRDLANASQLDSIKITNEAEKVVKNIKFNYSYFNNGISGSERLRLDSIKDITGKNAEGGTYAFTYNGRQLPSLSSYAQDHWGYFNGSSNSTLIPSMFVPVGNNQVFFSGANRETNASSLQAGILTEISYPTGGRTQFEYEPHDYGSIQKNPILSNITRESRENIAAVCSSTPKTTKTIVITADNDGEYGHPLAEIRVSTHGGRNGENPHTALTIDRIDGNGIMNIFTHYSGTRSPGPIPLKKGTYLLTASCDGGADAGCSMSLKWTDSIGVQKLKLASGLRIRKIVTQANNYSPAKVTEYKYRMDGEPDRSSGSLLTKEFSYNYIYSTELRANGSIQQNNYHVSSSFGLSHAGATQGNPVGYREVTVMDGDNGANGKTIYKYTSPFDYPDSGEASYPYAPPISLDYKRGHLLRKTVYRRSTAGFIPLIQTDYKYSFDRALTASSLRKVHGMKVGYSLKAEREYSSNFRVSKIEYISEWLHPTQMVEKRFSTDTTFKTVVTTQYCYANSRHMQLTGEQKTTHRGKVGITYRYPLDFVLPASTVSDQATLNLQGFVKRHVLTPVIERQKWSYTDKDSSLIETELTLYKNLLPNKFLSQDLSAPLPASQTIPTSVNAEGVLGYSSRYREETAFDLYNSQGKLLQQHQPQGDTTSYLWDYQNQQITAQIRRGAYKRVAYTSFEPNSPGTWRYPERLINAARAYTGRYSYELSGGLVQRMGLPNGDYIISFSYTGSGSVIVNGLSMPLAQSANWKYIQKKISVTTGSLTLSGSGLIDDLRLYPVGAQMTTYTHDPLVGMTSQTDPTGRTIFYEYDALGRLQRMRDEQGRVLTEQEYKYARP